MSLSHALHSPHCPFSSSSSSLFLLSVTSPPSLPPPPLTVILFSISLPLTPSLSSPHTSACLNLPPSHAFSLSFTFLFFPSLLFSTSLPLTHPSHPSYFALPLPPYLYYSGPQCGIALSSTSSAVVVCTFMTSATSEPFLTLRLPPLLLLLLFNQNSITAIPIS